MPIVRRPLDEVVAGKRDWVRRLIGGGARHRDDPRIKARELPNGQVIIELDEMMQMAFDNAEDALAWGDHVRARVVRGEWADELGTPTPSPGIDEPEP